MFSDKKILIYLQELYVLLFIKTLLAVIVAPIDTVVVVAVQLSTKIQVFVLVYTHCIGNINIHVHTILNI